MKIFKTKSVFKQISQKVDALKMKQYLSSCVIDSQMHLKVKKKSYKFGLRRFVNFYLHRQLKKYLFIPCHAIYLKKELNNIAQVIGKKNISQIR